MARGAEHHADRSGRDDATDDKTAGAGARHGALPLGRRLSRDGVPHRRAVAPLRGRTAWEPAAHLQRLRRLDHRRRAGAEMAQAELRPGAAADRLRAGSRGADARTSRARRSTRRPIVLGALLPGSISDRIAAAPTTEHLFHGATLQDLPDAPRFVINATNVQSGALWRFMKPYMRDYRVGEVKKPTIPLALAVAASSAFPPVLSPVEMRLEPDEFTPKLRHGSAARAVHYHACCSPTAASTTIWAWRPHGSAIRRSW